MTRGFLTPRVFEGPNKDRRAIKGYKLNSSSYFKALAKICEIISKENYLNFSPKNFKIYKEG